MRNMLTVIVPILHAEADLSRCLELLSDQTFSDWELAAVADASAGSASDLWERCERDPRFTRVTVKRGTSAASRKNAGVLRSASPYVTFFDPNDQLDPCAYAKCSAALRDGPDVVICGLTHDCAAREPHQKKYHDPADRKLSGKAALDLYVHAAPNGLHIAPTANNKLYRRSFLLDHGLRFHEGLRLHGDDIFTFQVLAQAETVRLVSGCGHPAGPRRDPLLHTVSEGSVRGFIDAYLALKQSLEASGSFQVNEQAFYLKFKSSLLDVIKQVLDHEATLNERDRLIRLLFNLLMEHFDVPELLSAFNS